MNETRHCIQAIYAETIHKQNSKDVKHVKKRANTFRVYVHREEHNGEF